MPQRDEVGDFLFFDDSSGMYAHETTTAPFAHVSSQHSGTAVKFAPDSMLCVNSGPVRCHPGRELDRSLQSEALARRRDLFAAGDDLPDICAIEV